MKKQFKRLTASLLALMMCLGLFGANVWATEDAEKLYAPVLDMLYFNIKTNWKYFEDDSSVSYYYSMNMTSKSDGKSISYCFKDINSDGIPEMLIGTDGTKNNDIIYDLYTCVEGKLYHLASSGARYRYYLLSDGTLMEELDGGAESEFYDHYKLKKNGKKLTFLDGLADTLEYNEYTDKTYRRIYCVTEDVKDQYGDWAESVKTDITESQMNSILKGWGTKTKFNSFLVVNYTPKSKTAVYEIVSPTLSKTSLKSAKTGKSGSINVTWKKNTNGKGYWVQCSTDKRFMKNVKTKAVNKNGTTKTTIKGLKKGTWYVRVCTVKGSSVSAWSKSKKVKVK